MAMSKTTIRKAAVSDYSQCLPLLASLYHGDIGTDFKKTFESYVAGASSIVLLAHSQGEIVGILIGSHQIDIDWEGKTARIDAIVVDEKNRRRRIGEELARSFVTLARRRRCRAVKSRVNVKNQVAQRFHESLGFERADTYEYTLDISSQR
jgi:ribosomal protein S18 acetylase RimI-like enzyme